MSNHLAVAAVTMSMKYLLHQSLEKMNTHTGKAKITALALNKIETSHAASPGLNLLLYQVTPNHGGNLSDLPTRSTAGAMVARPNAAVDLHYLVTAYGNADQLEAHQLLGAAILSLATTPVLTRDLISHAVDFYKNSQPFVTDVDLDRQPDLVKLSLEPLTVDELTRLWGMFPQASFDASVAYRATVVLLEAEVSAPSAAPVRTRNLGTSPRIGASLDAVTTDDGGPATTGALLRLTGSGLVRADAPVTAVRVGGVDLTPEPGGTAAELTVRLTDAVAAGIGSVQVRLYAAAEGGAPARERGHTDSLPLVLRPTVTTAKRPAGAFRVTVTPPVDPGQRAAVLLDRVDAEAPALSVPITFPQTGATPIATVDLPAGTVPTGTWVVRVEVDGVSSIPGAGLDGVGTPQVKVQ